MPSFPKTHTFVPQPSRVSYSHDRSNDIVRWFTSKLNGRYASVDHLSLDDLIHVYTLFNNTTNLFQNIDEWLERRSYIKERWDRFCENHTVTFFYIEKEYGYEGLVDNLNFDRFVSSDDVHNYLAGITDRLD